MSGSEASEGRVSKVPGPTAGELDDGERDLGLPRGGPGQDGRVTSEDAGARDSGMTPEGLDDGPLDGTPGGGRTEGPPAGTRLPAGGERTERSPDERVAPGDGARTSEGEASDRPGRGEVRSRAQEPAERVPREGSDDIGDFAGRGTVADFDGTFWDALEEGKIPTPRVMTWNEWQNWRKDKGGMPEGRERGREVQRMESALHKATMQRIYGDRWRDELSAVQERRKKAAVEGRQVVRQLFTEDGVSVMSSGSAAPPFGRMTNRANILQTTGLESRL